MKKSLKILASLTTLTLMATNAFAAQVELYALDGRTLTVEEEQVEAYTAEGMGWFKEKPVKMYSADGNTTVVPADRVEAQKKVGWFLEEQKPVNNTQNNTSGFGAGLASGLAPGNANNSGANTNAHTNTNAADNTAAPVTPPAQTNEKVAVRYTDGTIVSVPAGHVEMYKALGWVKYDGPAPDVTPEVPGETMITLYSHDGQQKAAPASQLEAYKAQGWYPAYDEAVYAYAAFGNGADVLGATQLLENKRYELAFNMVQDALGKIENTDSEYVSLLYYLRSTITGTWAEAAKSPLGFINYWFGEHDGKAAVIFEYRNVSNNRIKGFEINFDICDANGNVIETNDGAYVVKDLEMAPCQKQRMSWYIETGDAASKISNLKVKAVNFSDGTNWKAAN